MEVLNVRLLWEHLKLHKCVFMKHVQIRQLCTKLSIQPVSYSTFQCWKHFFQPMPYKDSLNTNPSYLEAVFRNFLLRMTFVQTLALFKNGLHNILVCHLT